MNYRIDPDEHVIAAVSSAMRETVRFIIDIINEPNRRISDFLATFWPVYAPNRTRARARFQGSTRLGTIFIIIPDVATYPDIVSVLRRIRARARVKARAWTDRRPRSPLQPPRSRCLGGGTRPATTGDAREPKHTPSASPTASPPPPASYP